jgi:hypothetical protein
LNLSGTLSVLKDINHLHYGNNSTWIYTTSGFYNLVQWKMN